MTKNTDDLKTSILLKKCLRGNRNAQFEIYKMYYKAMYNVSLKIVNDTAEAEDVMQESFLSAFEKLSSYRGEVTFGAWLKRIVVNKSIDALRKKKTFEEDPDQLTGIPTEYPDERDVEPPYNMEDIKKAIHMLPDNYRVVITLYLLEGYDHDEISLILNIQPSSSRAKLSRARVKLKEILLNMKKKY